MIVINDRNLVRIENTYGETVNEAIEKTNTILRKSVTDSHIRTDAFEIYAHDNLRNIQFCFLDRSISDYHNHTFYEFTYVVSGAIINNISGNCYLLETGDTIIMPPDTAHCLSILPDTKAISVYIRKQWFENKASEYEVFDFNNFASRLCKDSVFSIFSDNISEKYHNLVKDIISTHRTVYRSTGLYDNLHYENLFSEVLIELAKQNRTDFSYSSKKYDKDGSAQIILQYIIDNYNRISAEDVAKHFGLSRTHIFRILKNYTGVSFTRHISDVRMKQAKLMLLNTRLSISQIAKELGFKNRDGFSKAFKKIRLITPAQYRKFNHHVGKLRSFDVQYRFPR